MAKELSLAINLRDCRKMKFQNNECCANCYKEIQDDQTSKKFRDPLLTCHTTTAEPKEDESCSITLAQALITVFDLHRKSHLSSILLDETKYVLCTHCFNIFSQLYIFFKEFTDMSSPPSYLFSIIKRNPFFEPSLLLVEIKAEPEDFFPDNTFDGFDDYYGSPDLDVIPFTDNITTTASSSKERKFLEELDDNNVLDDPDFDIGTHDNLNDQREQVSIESKDNSFVRRSSRPRKTAKATSKALTYAKRSYIKKSQQSSNNNNNNKTILQSRRKYKRGRASKAKIKQTSFTCVECNAVFKRAHHLKRHSIQHSAKEFICECGVGFRAERNVQYHQRKNCPKNPDAGKYLHGYYYDDDGGGDDDDEDMDFNDSETDKTGEVARKRKPKNRKIVVCRYEFCGKKYKRMSTLLRHEARHKERPFLCSHCKQGFRADEILQLHILTSCPVLNNLGNAPMDDIDISNNVHTNDSEINTFTSSNATTTSQEQPMQQQLVSLLPSEKNFIDSGEGNTTTTTTIANVEPTALSQVVKKPVKKYSYSCYCGASFSRSNHLYRHSLTHMENPFTCPDCYTKFITQMELDIHTKKHNGNCRRPCKRRQLGESGESKPKQATCPICGRVVNAQSLKYHLESHGTEKLHICEVCGHAVKSKKTLNNHKTYAHSSTRRYLCRFCGRDFKTNQQLKFHEMRNHDDTEKMRKQAVKRQQGIASTSTTLETFNDYNIPVLPPELLGTQDAQLSNNINNISSMQEDYSNSNSQNDNNNGTSSSSHYQRIDDTSNSEQAPCTSETLLMNIKPQQLETLKLSIQHQIASNLIAQTPLSLDPSSTSSRIPALSHLYPQHAFPLHRPFNIPQQHRPQQQQQQQLLLQSHSSPSETPTDPGSSSSSVNNEDYIMSRSPFSQHSKEFQ